MPKNQNHIYVLLSVVIIILLFIIGVMMYFLLQKPSEKIIIKTIEKEVVSNNRSSDKNLIHPDELPKYNSNEYQQIGILTANETDKEPIVLPLFAKKLHNNRDRWNYYTATDKNNMMRLPIKHQNMDCEDNIGCREIYDGDKLQIEIYQGREFTATIYRNQAPQYFADRY